MLEYSRDALDARGARRAEGFLSRTETPAEALKGAKFLDVGCGLGESAAAIAQMYGADVIGVDPQDRHTSTHFANRFSYLEVGVEQLPAEYDNYFDFVQSYTVLEHIPDPVGALEHVYRVLKPGGKALLVANLWRGASASHVAHVLGDWCHLLMSFDEMTEQCRARGVRDPAPVNKLSYLEYIHHVNRIGFDWIKPAWLQWKRMPAAFYEENRDVLQWYPKVELDMDFLLLSISKSGRETRTQVDYLWNR